MPGTLLALIATPKPGAADQQRAVGLAFGDQPGRRDGDVRVGGVLIGADAHVDDLGDPGVGGQIALEGFLVLVSGVVGADDDPQSEVILRLLSRSE